MTGSTAGGKAGNRNSRQLVKQALWYILSGEKTEESTGVLWNGKEYSYLIHMSNGWRIPQKGLPRQIQYLSSEF